MASEIDLTGLYIKPKVDLGGDPQTQASIPSIILGQDEFLRILLSYHLVLNVESTSVGIQIENTLQSTQHEVGVQSPEVSTCSIETQTEKRDKPQNEIEIQTEIQTRSIETQTKNVYDIIQNSCSKKTHSEIGIQSEIHTCSIHTQSDLQSATKGVQTIALLPTRRARYINTSNLLHITATDPHSSSQKRCNSETMKVKSQKNKCKSDITIKSEKKTCEITAKSSTANLDIKLKKNKISRDSKTSSLLPRFNCKRLHSGSISPTSLIGSHKHRHSRQCSKSSSTRSPHSRRSRSQSPRNRSPSPRRRRSKSPSPRRYLSPSPKLRRYRSSPSPRYRSPTKSRYRDLDSRKRLRSKDRRSSQRVRRSWSRLESPDHGDRSSRSRSPRKCLSHSSSRVRSRSPSKKLPWPKSPTCKPSCLGKWKQKSISKSPEGESSTSKLPMKIVQLTQLSFSQSTDEKPSSLKSPTIKASIQNHPETKSTIGIQSKKHDECEGEGPIEDKNRKNNELQTIIDFNTNIDTLDIANFEGNCKLFCQMIQEDPKLLPKIKAYLGDKEEGELTTEEDDDAVLSNKEVENLLTMQLPNLEDKEEEEISTDEGVLSTYTEKTKPANAFKTKPDNNVAHFYGKQQRDSFASQEQEKVVKTERDRVPFSSDDNMTREIRPVGWKPSPGATLLHFYDEDPSKSLPIFGNDKDMRRLAEVIPSSSHANIRREISPITWERSPDTRVTQHNLSSRIVRLSPEPIEEINYFHTEPQRNTRQDVDINDYNWGPNQEDDYPNVPKRFGNAPYKKFTNVLLNSLKGDINYQIFGRNAVPHPMKTSQETVPYYQRKWSPVRVPRSYNPMSTYDRRDSIETTSNSSTSPIF